MGPNWLTLGGQIELLLPSDPSQSDRTAVTVGDVLQWIMWREVPTLSQFPLDSGPLFQLLANGGAWILAEHREIVWQKMIWRHITQMRDAIHKLCTNMISYHSTAAYLPSSAKADVFRPSMESRWPKGRTRSMNVSSKLTPNFLAHPNLSIGWLNYQKYILHTHFESDCMHGHFHMSSSGSELIYN